MHSIHSAPSPSTLKLVYRHFKSLFTEPKAYLVRSHFSAECVSAGEIQYLHFQIHHTARTMEKNAARGDALVCAHKSKESLASWLASREMMRRAVPFLGTGAYFCRELGKVCQASRPHFNSHTADHLYSFAHTEVVWRCVHAFTSTQWKNRTHTQQQQEHPILDLCVWCKRRISGPWLLFCSGDGVNYNKHYRIALHSASGKISQALCFTVFFCSFSCKYIRLNKNKQARSISLEIFVLTKYLNTFLLLYDNEIWAPKWRGKLNNYFSASRN